MKIRIYPKSLLEIAWQQDKLLFTPEAKQPPLCLRCGQPLDRRLVINTLSRYADVHICEACGMDEALRDANRCPLPLTEWAAVKNGLSQQQTDFEDLYSPPIKYLKDGAVPRLEDLLFLPP